RSQYGNFSKT
ncbi:hypothetical protein VCHENC02_3298B, partial [Vibrio harveyi]